MAKGAHFDFCVKNKSPGKTSTQRTASFFQLCAMLNKQKCLIDNTLVVQTFFMMNNTQKKRVKCLEQKVFFCLIHYFNPQKISTPVGKMPVILMKMFCPWVGLYCNPLSILPRIYFQLTENIKFIFCTSFKLSRYIFCICTSR